MSILWGQTSKGAVTGRAVDSGGGVLQGARIELQPSGVTTASNNQGEFTFNDVTPGAYRVLVTFVGFTPFTGDVTVTAGQTSRVDAALKVASENEQVVVTAERVHGEAESINRERTAENVLQVLPAEVITSLPNANVADALGRLPSVTLERDEGEGKYVQIRGSEPRYSNVTIDGVNVPSPENDVRQIKLDVVPSDLVESVEINKTLQANMDGDGIGGSVNLRTKTAGEQPTISLYGLGGYTPILNGRSAEQFGGTIGQRFGKDKRLGVLFGGTYDWNGRGINDVEPAPTTIQCDSNNCGNPSANAPYYGTYNTEDIREYRYNRGRFGFDGSADYRLDNGASFYLRGLYSRFDNYGDRWVFTPTINSFTTSPLQGGLDGNMSMNMEIRRPVQQIGSLVLGSQQVWPTWVLAWNVSISRSATDDQGYSTASFSNNDPNSPINNVQFGVNRSDPYRPILFPQNGVNIYDPSQYFLQGLDYNTSRSAQLNLQGGADLSKSYKWNGFYGTFAFGAKVRNAHKYNEPNDLFYNANDQGSIPLNMFPVSLTDNSYYDKTYTLGYMADYNPLKQFFLGHANLFSVDVNQTNSRNLRNQWDIIERVSSGYLMNSITFNRFRVYGGLRFEGTNEDNRGNLVQLQSGTISPLSRNGGYVDAVPSAEVRYTTTGDSGIRFAYSRGLARPNFGDLAPYLSLNLAGGVNRSSIGNPDLKATHADNFDLLFEQYLKPLGMIQAGYFYKRIADPIVVVQTTGVTYPGIPQTFIQTQPVNAGSAHVQGFEAAYQQRLSYLPGVLSALGISANYSYTTSQANGIPGRSDRPALLRQAPHTWNISPTYDRGRISFRLGLSYNAANIFQYNYSDGAPLGVHGPNGDVYLYAHLQIDTQASIRVAKGFSVIAYGLNLGNEVFGFYQGDPVWPIQREYYQPTIGGGLRWSSRAEK